MPSDLWSVQKSHARHGEPGGQNDLLLRETNHRCNNDLQLVVGMLALQGRRSTSEEAREALRDAMTRVEVLARSRRLLQTSDELSLEAALRQVCEGLQAHAELRSILVSLEIDACRRLSPAAITTAALVVNELATNAIKHAFREGRSGKIRVIARDHDDRHITIVVDDDGLPFGMPPKGERSSSGLGLDLVMRLIASIGGFVILPSDGSKRFELRIPVERA